MSATKVRAIIGAIVAIALVILFAAVGAALAGFRIPILSSISDALGIGPE